ncbi:MAG: CoF synthetase [Rhizobiaceae bacterium]|nr:CoF synthetase [Rhizobiaceae bacterium]
MRFVDMARSAYTSTPAPLRRRLAPLVALVPRSLKYGATFERWRRDIQRSEADREFAVERAQTQLRGLLTKAATGSAFWRNLLGAVAFATFEIEALASVPITTKQMMREAGDGARVDALPALIQATTSGSNAEAPFEFLIDADRSVREFAFVTTAWARAGYRPGDARAVLRGFRLDDANAVHQWDPALNELRLAVFPLGPAEATAMADEIERRGIAYIHGYPSAIELFARHLDAAKRRLAHPIRGIFPISEPVFAHQRALFARAFPQAEMVPFYGMSEKVAFAIERPGEPGVYTFEPLYGLAELVGEDGRPIAAAGAEGRLLGTGFISTGMPFIRYDTGDRARLVETATRANGWRLTVRDIAPRRKPDFLIADDGSRIVATDLVPEDVDLLRGLAEWQFVQDAPGIATLRYVPMAGGGSADAERLAKALEARTDGRLRFAIEEAASIASGAHGKRAFILQHIAG